MKRVVGKRGCSEVTGVEKMKKGIRAGWPAVKTSARIYKTVILPDVLYGCETWILTLIEDQRLRVFENKVLRKIFGAKRDEVTRGYCEGHSPPREKKKVEDLHRRISKIAERYPDYEEDGNGLMHLRAIGHSLDRNDKAHLGAHRGVNEHFTVSECLLDVITKYNWRRSFPGTERHHRTEEVEFAMACVYRNRRGSSFIRASAVRPESSLSSSSLHGGRLLHYLSLAHAYSGIFRGTALYIFSRGHSPPSSRDQNIVRNGTIKVGDLSFEEVEEFKYLRATVTNINDTREGIKRRINMGNACYYSVEKLLSSSLLSKNLKVRIYKTVILPVVLYGCETWTLTLREEQRLRIFENKVLRKIFGAKRDEVTGEWRKLHNGELHTLYPSPDIIRNVKSRRLRWAGHVARMGESRNAYRVLVGRPEGKRPLGRPRRRWEDNIKMDLREVGYDGRDWINLAQDRDQWRAYVRAAMNLRPHRDPSTPVPRVTVSPAENQRCIALPPAASDHILRSPSSVMVAADYTSSKPETYERNIDDYERGKV
ncbi:hypothetical protein ANN_05569 [Periplaneta americana]|uniref:Uncharacterized protein n=1 Tax=Periplaneta americana TaxID=6978 RepID=A0ABQ8TCX3_PERAM|nr:hypothetical protein ANN_05569 [Periplaneta americana]